MSTQSKHLPVLMAMFPGVVMLNVEQVATILHCAKGHLYNLCSSNRLPFKLSRDVGNRFLISIVEMAAYMDKTMLSDGMPVAQSEPVVVAKRKPGRPRGSTRKAKSQAVMAFQAELMSALGIKEPTEIAVLELAAHRVPFYADPLGCLISMPLGAEVPMLGERLGPVQVLWLTWAEGLSSLWQDESDRLGWLNKADQSAPGLRQRAEAIRHARLSGI